MEDFNRDNAKLDAALAEVRASAAASAATLAQHTAAIAKLGNCQIYTTSYAGTNTFGQEHPTQLQFPKRPAASAATLAQHTAAIAKLGNCQIYTTSYAGTNTFGQEHPTQLQFPKRPMLVFIFGGRHWFMGHPDSGIAYSQSGGGNAAACTISRSGNQISWYIIADPHQQMNGYNTSYKVLALLDAAQ